MVDRITLGFAADTTEVERGTDRIADSLDDVNRKLDEVGQTGEDAGQAAAGGLDEAGGSATDVTGKLGALGDVASNVLEGDIAGGARSAAGALSGLAALIPGIGTAIGAGLALAANAFIGSWEKAAKANEERIRSMYDDMIKSGNDFASTNFVNSSISDVLNDEARLTEVKNDAATAGVRVSLALRAEAGDQLALASMLQSVRDRREELTAAQEAYIAKNGVVNASLDEQLGGLDQLEVALGTYGTASDTAASKADLYRDATENAGTATGNLGDAIDNLPDSVFVGIEVDTVAAQKKFDAFIADLRNRHIPIVADVVDRYGRSLD